MYWSLVSRNRRVEGVAVAAFLLSLLVLSLLIVVLTLARLPLEFGSAIGDPKAVVVANV